MDSLTGLYVMMAWVVFVVSCTLAALKFMKHEDDAAFAVLVSFVIALFWPILVPGSIIVLYVRYLYRRSHQR